MGNTPEFRTEIEMAEALKDDIRKRVSGPGAELVGAF